MVVNLNKKEKDFISKKAILRYFSDLDIYRTYMDGDDVQIGKAILSPLRKEAKPSFGFFIGESAEICFKDHVLGSGDCIKFVQMKYGLTYFEALSKIATDLDLADDFICKNFKKTDFEDRRSNFISREELLAKSVSQIFGKKSREWKLHDILYWEQFGISVSTLEKFKVQPISHIFINDKIYTADKHAYVFIEGKDAEETYKIYQPFNKDYKWINNHDDSVWQGWEALPNVGKELIITKSLKDVMSLYEVAKIPAVALQSENILPKLHVYNLLETRFNSICLLYDNDYDKDVNWGKQFGDRLGQYLQLYPIYIDDEYECKDFSDLVKKYGRETAVEVLEKAKSVIPF